VTFSVKNCEYEVPLALLANGTSYSRFFLT
jgi:hypothetical protein